jgi:hypothetical protein
MIAPAAEALAAPGGPLDDPVAAQALAMIGLPAGAFRTAGDHVPGLGAPLPGIEAANAIAALAAGPAGPSPRRRIRVTQRA